MTEWKYIEPTDNLCGWDEMWEYREEMYSFQVRYNDEYEYISMHIVIDTAYKPVEIYSDKFISGAFAEITYDEFEDYISMAQKCLLLEAVRKGLLEGHPYDGKLEVLRMRAENISRGFK